ncbi:MAG: FHA domain-containing protein [Deltaproteobacteria bacterium]
MGSQRTRNVQNGHRAFRIFFRAITVFLLILLCLPNGWPGAVSSADGADRQVQAALSDFLSSRPDLSQFSPSQFHYHNPVGNASLVKVPYSGAWYTAIYWEYRQILFIDLTNAKVVTDPLLLNQVSLLFHSAAQLGSYQSNANVVDFSQAAKGYQQSALEYIDLAKQAQYFQISGLAGQALTGLYKILTGKMDLAFLVDFGQFAYGLELLLLAENPQTMAGFEPDIKKWEDIDFDQQVLQGLAKGTDWSQWLTQGKGGVDDVWFLATHYRSLDNLHQLGGLKKLKEILGKPDSALSLAQRKIKAVTLEAAKKLVDPTAGFQFVADQSFNQWLSLSLMAAAEGRAAELCQRLASGEPVSPHEATAVLTQKAVAFQACSDAFQEQVEGVENRYSNLNIPLILSNALGWIAEKLQLPSWWPLSGWTGDDLQGWKELAEKLANVADLIHNGQEQMARDAERAVQDIQAFLGSSPQNINSSDTVLVCDVSGSMGESFQGQRKIDSARQAGMDLLRMIALEYQAFQMKHNAALVEFSTTGQVLHHLSADFSALESAIMSIAPQASTNLGEGISLALSELQNSKSTNRLMIVLSDGNSNEGISPEQILVQLLPKAKALGVRIYTVGFGDRVLGAIDEELLNNIAVNSGAKYFYAGSGFDLSNIYVAMRHQSMGTMAYSKEGIIHQGETVELGSFTVDSQKDLLASVNWPGSLVELSLQDPNGRIVDNTYPGVTIQLGPPTYLIVQKALAGTWQASVYGQQVPEGEIPFQVLASQRDALLPASGEGKGFLVILFVLLGVSIALSLFFFLRPKNSHAWIVAWQDPQGRQNFTRVIDVLQLGRASNCQLRFPWDRTVSNQHARLIVSSQELQIDDLDSTNGTWVNEERIQRAHLHSGDRIRLGQQNLWILSSAERHEFSKKHKQQGS